MESASSVFPVAPTPVLVALLAGIFFLYRAWPRLLVRDTKLRHEKTDAFDLEVSPAEDESQVVSKESDLPAGWLVGKDVFELERRAIFSKSWLYLSHRSRFTRPGDYQSFEVAGFPIFLILGKDGTVRAFHNVCRHRAYAVTHKESGSSAVLGCRYHGWSYNTFGQLIKAPHFDQFPGFDKSQNSLFEIHCFTSGSGFVFVNFEAGLVSSTVETGGLDVFVRENKLAESSWAAGQRIEGAFNWKMGLRSKEFVSAAQLEQKTAQPNSIPLVENVSRYFQRKSDSCSVFPVASFHTIKGTGYWFSLGFFPVSEQKASIRYDLYRYRNTGSTPEAIPEKIIGLLNERVRQLETEYQSYLDSSGDSNSVTSGFDSDTQMYILDQLRAHAKIERIQGAEVSPAMRKPRENPKFQQAEQLCKELECASDVKGKELAW